MKKYIVLIVLLILPNLAFSDNDRVFRENSNSIVLVTAYNKAGKPLTEGSGFIASRDGAIVTNYHVIGIAKDIKVRAGGRLLPVTGVIYADKENDIVILQAAGKDLPAVRLGDTAEMHAGEKIYIISGTEESGNLIDEGFYRGMRTLSPGRRVIEITAPVSHGSSGSAVFNKNGEVIGITTFLIKRAQHLVLAMPVSLIRDKIRIRGATTPIQRIIKDYKKTADYWFYLGYYLSKAGAQKESIDVLREAVRLKPDFSDAYYYLGIAYEKLNKHNEAIGAFRKAVRFTPDFADAYFSLGVIYGEKGMYKEALEALEQAVAYAPDFSDAYYNMGVVYERSGMFREGIEANKNAVRLRPDFADAHYNLGIAYEKSGYYKEAADAFKEVLKIIPGHAEAQYNLGIVYLLLNDKKSALASYQKLKNIDTRLADKLLNLINK